MSPVYISYQVNDKVLLCTFFFVNSDDVHESALEIVNTFRCLCMFVIKLFSFFQIVIS